MTDYHPTVQKIIDLLTENNCWHETFEHEPVRTSEEAAAIRPEYTLHQGAKAIVVRVKLSKKNKYFAMLVFPGDMRFDNQKVKDYFSAKDIRFATEDEVSEITDGVQPGGVPPFGNLFDLPIYVAPELLKNEKIVFNAGDRRFSVGMNSADFVRLANPTEFDMLTD